MINHLTQDGLFVRRVLENADGIQKGDEIYFRGIKIGNVLESSIIRNGVMLNLKIDKLDKIPIDSKFKISDFSLISGKAIQINPGISEKYLQPGDTIKGSAAYGVNQAIAVIKDLSPKIDKVLSKFLNKSSNAVEQLNSLLTGLNEGKGSLGGIVKNDSLYQNLNHSITSIDSLVSDIKQNPKKYINVSVF